MKKLSKSYEPPSEKESFEKKARDRFLRVYESTELSRILDKDTSQAAQIAKDTVQSILRETYGDKLSKLNRTVILGSDYATFEKIYLTLTTWIIKAEKNLDRRELQNKKS